MTAIRVESGSRERAALAARRRLVEGNVCLKPPITTKMPVPYHWIPGEARVALARLLFRPHVRHARATPSAYADDTTDALIRGLGARGDSPTWSWPGGKRCAVVLSHDTDSPGQASGIDRLRRMAEARGARNTFTIVWSHFGHYRSLIRDLKAAGHDVGLHDVVHDNTIAFKPAEEIAARLAPAMDDVRELGIVGFRSPSWYTSALLWEALSRLGFRYDISVLDAWPFFEPGKVYGVGSFFPFLVGDLVVLPNTIPFEIPRNFGFSRRETFDFWRPKFDAIAAAGGLVMFNAHPDRWWAGNPVMVEQLARCVDYLLERYDAAVMTAAEVGEHTRAEEARGATVDLGGDPPVRAPRHAPADLPAWSQPDPMTTPRRTFLAAHAR